MISLEGLSTGPQLALEPSLGGEPIGSDRSSSSADAAPLPPAIAATLRDGPLGLGLATADDLSIVPTPDSGDWMALMLGGTSVLDAGVLTRKIGEPAPEASPAPARSLR